MNIKLNPPSFDVIHRLSDKDFAPIIIKFSSRTDRNVFYDARSQLKNLGYDPNPNTKNKIYINESLTKRTRLYTRQHVKNARSLITVTVGLKMEVFMLIKMKFRMSFALIWKKI